MISFKGWKEGIGDVFYTIVSRCANNEKQIKLHINGELNEIKVTVSSCYEVANFLLGY